MTHEITTDQMMVDLLATFPGIRAKVRRCPWNSDLFAIETWSFVGVVDIGNEPMFTKFNRGSESTEDESVHPAFVAWLLARGWSHKRWDDFLVYLMPVNALNLLKEAA